MFIGIEMNTELISVCELNELNHRLGLQRQRGPKLLHHSPGIHLILCPDIYIPQMYLIQC